MSSSLAGKVAIVTASTKGIGYAIVKKLAKDGAKVVLSSRKQTNVDQALASLKADEKLQVEGTVCHVSVEEDRKALIDFTLERHKRIDILVSNAAVNPHFGDLLDVSEKQWDKMFDVNVKSAFLLSKAVAAHMKEGSSIVYVSSVGGYTPMVHIGAYSVTKTALIGLTKAMALSVAHRGIRVNAIAPGLIKTDFSAAMLSDQKTAETMCSLIPLGRLGEPDDCAGTVSFLVSENARYITGEVVLITGGINARL